MHYDKLPEIDRHCPKCCNERAYGPEYRRGIHADEGLGEHLRYYCTVCRYLMIEPTHDQDTPDRRRELVAAFEQRQRRWAEQRQQAADRPARDREIAQVRRADTGRRGWGWK